MFRHSQKPAEDQQHDALIDDARNPNSSTSAGDVEKKIIDDTKAAGGVAFQFDPDASPEEKAAQARSRVPADFHHEKKPKATGIVSDQDDGSAPQYDLPSPSKVETVSRASSVRGSRAGSLGNEDMRWARDRVGWAPRFGYGDPADDEGPNLLDHQTLLESKLDEKWYGDWYYNAGIIIFACLATYICTILGGGLFCMIIIMAACGTYYRTSLRRVRRNFRDDVHREMAKARLESDTESLEWINSFLVKFWPIYAPVLCDTIIAAVDQVLSTQTPAFLDSLRMKTFTLGTKPPRLEHVKTYVKTEEDIVLMDWKFSFTPNDTADMTARQLKNKINPKVALEIRIGKGVVSKGLDVIVEDFAFSGLMRVKVKLQKPFPHIERAEMCFLGRPDIDYVCKPLGGDTFGFDINFIPGLESFIQEQIHGNLAPIMYEPNVFPIEIAKMLAGNPVDQAIGVLQVSMHGAQGLKNPDKFPGVPDPYVTVSINGRDVLGKTKTITENSNPRWNETVNVIITSMVDTLTLQVFDYNEYRKDKDLGIASFALDQLQNETIHENLHLEVMAGGKARGIIQADIRFFPVLEGEKNADGTVTTPESNTGIAKFTVEQAKDLDGSRSFVGQLNPYAVLLLNGKEIKISKILKRTNNPIWPDADKEVLITDRKSAKLGLVIKDDRGIAADPILATYQVKLADMIELQARGQEWFHLAQTKTGRAKMMLQWKPVALKGAMGGGGYVTPIGVMRFHFQNARELRNFETVGKSDPYVRVLLSGIVKGRTVTWSNNLNPDFDEVIYVPIHSNREKMVLEVMDEEGLGKDRSLGSIHVNASDYLVKGEDGAYLTHNEKRVHAGQLKIENRGSPKGTLNYTASFFPTLAVEDPAEDTEADADDVVAANGAARMSVENGRPSMEASRASLDKSENGDVDLRNRSERSGTISSLRPGTTDEKQMAKKLAEGEKQQDEVAELKSPELPKIKITPEDIAQYESGLIVFKVKDVDLAHKDCYLEVVMDDMFYPAYSTRIKQKVMSLNETSDAMVRELDVSRITLRLMEKVDKKGEGKDEHVFAKLAGQTIDVLRQGLMRLDPSESINNMGNLRVDVHDAAELPAADRNGYSDPYCKFILNDKQIYKTEVQKKTLHPAWNESFDVPVKSRTAAVFKVECWDWDRGGGDDLLGTADINLEILEPFQPQTVHLGLDGKSGSLRLRLLFKPDYVTRVRQGSSTFRGTFQTPGKIVGAPVKGVGKAGSFVGGNVISVAKGARGIFRRKKTGENGEEEVIMQSVEDGNSPDGATPKQSSSMPPSSFPRIAVENGVNGRDGRQSTPSTPPASAGHNRVSSFGTESMASGFGPSSSAEAEKGEAHFTIEAATGFEGENITIFVRQPTSKGLKSVFKTKPVKAARGDGAAAEAHFTGDNSFQIQCRADEALNISVRDTHTFGADKDLGEGMLVVSDAASHLAAANGGVGAKKTVPVGSGQVIVTSSFQHSSTSQPEGGLSPGAISPARGGTRKSFLGRMSREKSRGRDSITPNRDSVTPGAE
ncbi:MAG: hypothetical protein Q9162_006833 [Coniocarpon cinnabarinum]